ncbi:DUF2062 domain-containing protein [Paenibacillus sp. FSL H8-0537]|uniref:DUF2062 domain-containing protein n=1 Tax=Paenibacillus sp. FSL H8-0537 TaxID=2921399 RepID=UPI00310156CE
MRTKMLRKFKYYCLRLLRIKKSDHVVALGSVLGFLHCWFPTFIVGLPISLLLTRLLRGNLAACVIFSTIGSITWPGLFYLNYKVGFWLNRLVGAPAADHPAHAANAVAPPLTHKAGHFASFGHLGMNFLIGSIVNSIVFSLLGYFVIRFILGRYRPTLVSKLKSQGKGVRGSLSAG